MKNLKTITKLVVITSIITLSSYLTIAQRNVPHELYTIGTLDPNDNPPVLENDNTIWTFLNETDCDFSLNMIFHLNGNTSVPYFYDGQINIPRQQEPNTPGVAFITNSQLFDYFGLSGTALMSHLIFEITYNGNVIQTPVSATQITRINIPGCGTVCWIPNLQNKTFTLKRC